MIERTREQRARDYAAAKVVALHARGLDREPESPETERAWDEYEQCCEQAARREAARAARAAPDAPARLRQATAATALLDRTLPAEEHLLGSLITRTARVFLVGSTGTGKTMLALALAGGMASGQGFLHWRSARPCTALYIDGEMPLRALQSRVRDMARRIGADGALDRLHLVSWQNAGELGIGDWEPLNTEAGADFMLHLCNMLRPDVVIFDNVQALLAGAMKDEEPWAGAWPLIAELTSREIGQLWIDHTGHDTSRQYGTSTKAWRFDSVGIMTPLPKEDRAPGETGFTLSFEAPGKARNRAPDNWEEYAPHVIRLREDAWTGERAGGLIREAKVPPCRQVFHEALTAAINRVGAAPGETTRGAWEAECVNRGLIEADGKERKMPLRRARMDLIAARWIAVEGERVIDLKHRWD